MKKIVFFFKDVFSFIMHIIERRYLIYELTKRDFIQQYIQNVFGLVWAILDPLSFMLILWFVFGVGLRGGRNMSVPFITYLVTGIAGFTFFRATLTQGAGVVKAYSFLVKKVDFKLSILPLVKIFSNIVLHFIILFIVILILSLNKIYPSFFLFQVIYYMFALSCFLLGIIWFSAAIRIFFPDISNIITIITQFLFYFTPIFWEVSSIPEKYRMILKINPMFYIINGYRDCFLFHNFFWTYPYQTLYFWGITVSVLFVGIIVFKKLQPHFADVV